MLALLVMIGCASQPSAVNTSGTSADSTASSPTSLAENSPSGEDPNEMICRREQVTGTNFRRRVCMTRAQRESEQADSQEEMLERRSAVR
jgi:hypothetical protein